jgi:hypothetical protein
VEIICTRPALTANFATSMALQLSGSMPAVCYKVVDKSNLFGYVR